MLHIMLSCARSGRFVPTGIETDIDTFAAMPDVLSRTHCPACGHTHYWTKKETWFCEAQSASSAILPAEIVLRS